MLPTKAPVDFPPKFLSFSGANFKERSCFFGTSSVNNALTTSAPMASTPTSEASTKVDSDISVFSHDHKGLRQPITLRAQYDEISRDIFLFLVAFRMVNALSIRTFFQPDEYFQSLEPAWQIAFGTDSGAWITWVRSIWPHGQPILMCHIGMETLPSIRDPPLSVCGDLQNICSYLHRVRSLACVPRRPLHGQPKGAPGIDCSRG